MEARPSTRLKINIAVLLFLVAQTGAAIWWASSINAAVGNTRNEIDALKIQINSGSAVYLTRDNVNDILSLRDEQINTLKQSQLRIESKIDRLLEDR